MNKKFVADYNADYKRNPDFFSVGGWDGMHAIYESLKKTNGDTDGEKLIGAVKGMAWESPRGADLDRPRNARHHPEGLHPPRGEGGRQDRQCRVRQGREGEGPGQSQDEDELIFVVSALLKCAWPIHTGLAMLVSAAP